LIARGQTGRVMKVSRQGIIEIASHEAIVDMPYRDSKGIWTIGIGHTASAGPPDPSQMPRGRRIPLSEIFRIFAADLATFEKRVNKAVKVPVAQHEFDALTSFDFNSGGIDRATLVRHLNSGDRAKAATAFMNWSKPPEIIDRRTKEMELFRSGHYSSSGKLNVYPADNNGHVLWRRGKTVDASKILDPSVFEGAPEAPLYSAPVILRIGSTGDAVALVQKKVGVEADGWFGPITEAAVKDYQRSEGLVPDGIVGPITMKAMRMARPRRLMGWRHRSRNQEEPTQY
jgi:lysozyme